MKFYTSAREAFEALGLALPPELEPVEARFPVYLNEYYLKLIDPADWKTTRSRGRRFPLRRSWPTNRRASIRWRRRSRWLRRG